MKKISLPAVWILLCTVFLLSGCYVEFKAKKADDDLTKKIYETFGEDIFYISKEESQETYIYDFLLKKPDKEVVKKYILTIDEILKQSSKKIAVHMYCERPGALEGVLALYNYSDTSPHEELLKGAKSIYIGYCTTSDGEVFMDPEIYMVLEDVEYLYMDKEMLELTEEQEIDWREVWPTLKEIWIYDGGERYKLENETQQEHDTQ